MSRSSLGYGLMRSHIGGRQQMYGSNTKSIQNSIGSSMRMNPGEEMSVITVNEKILEQRYRESFRNNYKGENKVGKKNVYGELMFENGDYYVGFWENDRPQGNGVYIFDTSRSNELIAYVGQFERGVFSGFGKLFTAVSMHEGYYIYQGNWKNGKREGFGHEFYNHDENQAFTGYWNNDERHGEGRLIMPNGEYTGGWENGRMHGSGKLFLHDHRQNMKTIYDGEWVNDEFTHGKVTYYKIQEGKEVEVGNYDGQMKDLKRHGKGIYKNDSLFIGSFEEDSPKGKATIQNDQYKLTGDYNASQLQNAQCQIHYSNADTFKGSVDVINNMIKRKQGIYTFENKDRVQGKFNDNNEGELSGSYKYVWKGGDSKNFNS